MSIIFIFKFQSRIRQMSDNISQELFLNVKERLDYYHLPTTFPIEATTLLSKLIKLIDGNQKPHQSQSLPAPLTEGLSAALRHEMGHVVKENNKLHMDLMAAREEIQSLQHRLYKGEANKHAQAKQAEKVCALKGQRQQELLQELRQVRYKYNELMDFLHEDPKAEREYIKRLMKHRHQQIDHKEQEQNSGARQSSPGRDKTHSSQRIKQLQAKVKHREAEILRLQNIIQYDGMDMNKIIKRFQDSLTDNKLKVADSKINFLQESLDKTTRENQNMKNNNGSKEALRIQVQKCHKIIQSLKKQSKQLKRNNQEQNFDIKKQTAEQERKASKAKAEKAHLEKQSKHRQQIGNQLTKKVSFLEKEAQELRQELQHTRKQKSNVEQGKSKLQKKNEQLRVFYEYEIDTFKKKLEQVQFQLHESKAALKRAAHQSDVLRREGDVKTQSILNLEKIVNELLKKNTLLSDNTLGTLQNLKHSEDVQTKRQLIDLQQQLIYAQNQRQQLDNDRRAIEQRLAVVIRDNERFKADLSYLKNDVSAKENAIIQLTNQLQDLKFVHKKTQAELSRATSQLAEIAQQKTSFEENLRQQNERLLIRERALRSQLKQAEIKLSEEQGTLDITRIKLAEREERIRHIERLLNETVEQSKTLSGRVAQLEDQTHELARQKHRTTKKYEEIRKQAEDFKNGSFKNYEAAINDDVNERNRLKEQIRRLAEAQERLQIRYEQVNGLLNLVRREKELQQVEKIDLQRQVQHLQIRLLEMQEIERALVIQNQNIRNAVRRT